MNRLAQIVLALGVALSLGSQVQAAASVKLSDIELQGLQNIDSGTVFTYLPYRVGDEFSEGDSTRVVRDLYKTGFFRQVEVDQRGDVLVVKLSELPTIGELKFSGNDKVEKADLEKALKSAGLVKGRILNRAVLEQMEQELQRLYFSMGLYGMKVDVKQTELPGNRVALDIEILEGTESKIRSISFVGNQVFSEQTLASQFALGPKSWWEFYSSKDQYSRQKLAADLEKLRSFYLDRGYVKFAIESTEVSMSPDRKDIYITIGVKEGDQYKVSGLDFAGNTVVDEAELRKLVVVKDGQPFSRKELTESTDAMVKRVGNEGYAFANINPVPQLDEVNKTVKLTLYVDPGKRVYVRNISIRGNYLTDEEVFRRELRQMEASWYSGEKLDRSKTRLQRLPYVESASVETKPVPGKSDVVDVNVGVTEQMSGQFSVGVGYSQSAGMLFNLNVAQSNFLGTGNTASIKLDRSASYSSYSLSYLDPYWTVDGVSAGINLFYTKTDTDELNSTVISRYVIDSYGADLRFSMPMSESLSAKLGFGVSNADLKRTDDSPDWVKNEGYGFYSLVPGLSFDTRDRVVFPNSGIFSGVYADITLPGSGLEFYKLNADYAQYFSLYKNYVLKGHGLVGYGDSYGKSYSYVNSQGETVETPLPPFRNYYAGGVRSVRGYEDFSLSSGSDTIDSNGDPMGGAFKVVGGLELSAPVPFLGAEMEKNVRFSLFYDIGNVYYDASTFDGNALRMSAGVSLNWISPIGPLILSYAVPFNDQPGDQLQAFQFSVGSGF
ncbi:MAG: outer membrane protein assembly factor BamA [Pseudomonadota bacterium]